MRVILFADGLVGKNITQYLLEEYKADIISIIAISKNEITELAEKHNIHYCLHDNATAINTTINNSFDLGILAWWPKIISIDLIKKAKRGFLNTHPSFLPYNRGKHYNFWALVEQAPFGVTLHMVDKGIDTGPIVSQKKIVYDWLDNGQSLYEKAQDEMTLLFKETYPTLRKGNVVTKPQTDTEGSFHHSSEILIKSHINLDKEYVARDLLNLLRARTFSGYPSCWFEDGEKRYEVSIKINQIK